MALPDLRGKQVLITGAASGIGRASALAFAREGAHIIACDLQLESLRSLQDEIQKMDVNCLIHVVDVSDETAMRNFASLVHEQIGAPDILLNNAGIAWLGRLLDCDMASWRRVIDVNLMGVVHGCSAFIPMMLAAGGPRQVVNISSAASFAPAPIMGSYAASKHAVAGFSEVLRMELELDRSQIGVTTVFPGVINTAITSSGGAAAMQDEQLQRLRAFYAKEGGAPEIVANDLVRAVKTGKTLVLSGPYARLMYHVRRVSRWLLHKATISGAHKLGYK